MHLHSLVLQCNAMNVFTRKRVLKDFERWRQDLLRRIIPIFQRALLFKVKTFLETIVRAYLTVAPPKKKIVANAGTNYSRHEAIFKGKS